MQVYLQMTGCRLNEAELQSWSRLLSARGHGLVGAPEEADVVVLNTCGVTAEAGRTSRKLARTLQRQNPRGKLVVTGCYATLEPENLEADLYVPNSEKDALVEKLECLGPAMPASARTGEVFPVQRTRAFVKVQDGCNNRCTFCIVTVARGDERSRTIPEIVEEIRHLEELGHKEVVLTGVHLGGWGSERGERLGALVEAVLEQTSVPRIRMGSLEPWDLDATFFGAFTDPRLCPHLHLPLQSGSDRILRKMARRVTTAAYADLVSAARKVPSMQITTDIIVGFPGETEADFSQTVSTLESLNLSDLHVFRYSRREGTAAARMADHVRNAVKVERSRVLHRVAAEGQARARLAHDGQVRSVLFEKPQRDGLGRGYTDTYQKVITCTVPSAPLTNQIRSVALVAREGVLRCEL